ELPSGPVLTNDITTGVSARTGLVALLCLLTWQTAFAQTVFEVRRFVIEGATLLAPERIDAALAPSMGADRTIDDLQRARAALESMYARRGYGASHPGAPAGAGDQ
ncbi:MAG: POTRA domain-containing protein, partial [Burkholderiales bacterium]